MNKRDSYVDEKEKYKVLASEIEDGSFFKRGIEWYLVKFLFSSSEKVFLFYYTFAMVITFSVSVAGIFYSFPSVIGMRIMYFNSNIERVARPVRLNSETDSSSSSLLAKYLVENYVKERETYSYEESESRISYISNNSSRVVFKNYYENYMGEKNRNSLLLLLQDTGKRYANIQSVKIINDSINEHPYKAEVKINITESNGGFAVEKKFFAEIVLEFDMPTLSLVKNNYLDFFFTVTRYDVLNIKEI